MKVFAVLAAVVAFAVAAPLASAARPQPKPVTLSTSSSGGGFATTPNGPFTPTLSAVVPAGSSSADFYYRDTLAGTATITASTPGRQSATQAETVGTGALASLTLSPAGASITLGSSQTFTAGGADAYGNRVTPTVSWTASGGSVSSASGTSTTFTATATGTAHVTATAAGGVSAGVSVTITGQVAHVASITYRYSGGTLFATVNAVPNATVGLRILKSGTTLTNGTVKTSSTGTATASVTAKRGCYSATVTSLSAPGSQWDGQTPSNGACF